MRIEGIYRRHVDLASGRFAVIEKSREFTLVLWRPVLERNLGKSVSGGHARRCDLMDARTPARRTNGRVTQVGDQ
jgi:hypothetical protein